MRFSYYVKPQTDDCQKTYHSHSARMFCPPFHSDWRCARWLLVLLLFLVPSFPVLAQEYTPQTCATNLTEAQNQLFQGDFEQAVVLIRPCIEANAFATTDELIRAYELLANVYLATNNEEQARATITRLLETNPAYEPDPDQSRSDYVLLISDMRALLPPETPEIESTDLSVTITWQHLDSLAVEYALLKGTSASDITPLTTINVSELLQPPDNTMRYTDTNVAYNTRYYYALVAIKANGVRSARSDVVTVVTIPEPELLSDTSEGNKKKISQWVFIGGGVTAGGILAWLFTRDRDNPPPVVSGGDGELPFPPPVEN